MEFVQGPTVSPSTAREMADSRTFVRGELESLLGLFSARVSAADGPPAGRFFATDGTVDS
jgi:hypothetical protein